MNGDPESILGSEDGAAYRRFLDWSLGAGFDLAIVKMALPAKRNALIAWTKEQVPAACEIDLMQVGPERSRLWDLLNEAVHNQGATMLIAHGLEQAPAPARILAQLNVERDELVKTFALPWILFVHPAIYPELVHKAPDFVDFAGLWLEETDSDVGSSLPMAQPATPSESRVDLADASRPRENLLPKAAGAIAQSRLDEARDLLARYELEKPETQEKDATRILARCLRALADNRLEDALQLLREKVLPAYERMDIVQAITMLYVTEILHHRGEADEALVILRENVLPAVARLEDGRIWAIAQGQLADILQARGEEDEALRIRREEQLPAFERMGDVRLRAIAQGRVADILQGRGELDEALRIRREEELPVYERLGDMRERAITLGKVADILVVRGELDEALRIWRQDSLPVLERVGDARARAVILGRVANILEVRGEWDEALRIRREEELPVYERLGDVRSLFIGRANLATTLIQRGRPEDAPEVAQLLALALADARRLRLPEAQQIETIVRDFGLDPHAPPFV